MKTLKIAVALLAVIVLGSILFRTPTEAASSNNPIFNIGNVPLPVTDTNAGKYTHVGQKAGQLVVLKFGFNATASRVDLATGFEQEFKVPANFVFVLTDIHEGAFCNPGQSVGYILYQKDSDYRFLRDKNWTVCTSSGDTAVVRHFTTGMPFIAGTLIETGFNPAVDNTFWGEGYLVPAN